MSDPRFLQDGFEARLSHFIEECGEALAAAGKTQRWGANSVNPLLPKCDQETNLAWLRREMADLRQTLDRLDEAIELEFGVRAMAEPRAEAKAQCTVAYDERGRPVVVRKNAAEARGEQS